jgi:hypothetical protein
MITTRIIGFFIVLSLLAVGTTLVANQIGTQIVQKARADSKEQSSSFNVGFNLGVRDSNADAEHLFGHGCYTVPSGHSSEFGRGYAAGYQAGACGSGKVIPRVPTQQEQGQAQS